MMNFIVRFYIDNQTIVEYTIIDALGAFDARDKAIRKFRNSGIPGEVISLTIEEKI